MARLTADPSEPIVWAGAQPLVLASKSASRRALLAACGLEPDPLAVDLDERALEERHFAAGGSLEALAEALARAKALAASALRPDAYCLGADQTLTVGTRLLHKARDRGEAAQSLAALAGRAHRLTSAFCVARAGTPLVVDSDAAQLTMRTLDEGEIRRYLDCAGPRVLASVGVYQLEGLGVHLFDRVQGDHFTILGLPLLKVLAWLRSEGLLSL
jgi:septum formation protein